MEANFYTGLDFKWVDKQKDYNEVSQKMEEKKNPK